MTASSRGDVDNTASYAKLLRRSKFVPDLRMYMTTFSLWDDDDSMGFVDVGDVPVNDDGNDSIWSRLDPVVIANSPIVIQALHRVLCDSRDFFTTLTYILTNLENLNIRGSWNGMLDFCKSCQISASCLECDRETIHFHVMGTNACLHCCVSELWNVYIRLHCKFVDKKRIVKKNE